MMKVVVSWVAFWLGDIVSKPMLRFDWAWLYPVYGDLMSASYTLQGDDDRGPWGKIELGRPDA